MKKKALRQQMLASLRKQDREQKASNDAVLLEELINLSAYQKAGTVATYLSTDLEFNTQPLIQRALADGKRVVAPKALPNRDMVFMVYDANNIQQSTFGVPEPVSGEIVEKSSIDMIHVPGLAWNKTGFRVGYGGGFYDCYLADFRGKTISTIYDFQLQEFEEEPFDIAVQEVLILGKR